MALKFLFSRERRPMNNYSCSFRLLVLIKSLPATNSWNSNLPWEEAAIFHFKAIIMEINSRQDHFGEVFSQF